MFADSRWQVTIVLRGTPREKGDPTGQILLPHRPVPAFDTYKSAVTSKGEKQQCI